MSALLQKIMMALARRGIQAPIDESMASAYRALQAVQEQYPTAFPAATEILLAEIEGGATTLDDIPRRIGHLVQMLDRLSREEELDTWVEDQQTVIVT